MADTNPYDALIQIDTAGALRSTMAQVVDRNPDAEARLQQLARTHNMPVDAVRLRLPEIEHHDKLAALDYDTLAQQYPKTATTLADPARAGVAHDEVDGMSTLERVARQFSGGALEAGGMMLRGFGIGTDLAQRNILGAITELLPTPRGGAMTPEAKQTAIGPLLGEDFRRVGGDVKGYARNNLMLPGGQQTYVDQVVAGVGQVGGQIVAMPLVGPAGLYLQGLDAMDEKVGGDNAPQWKKDLATVGGAAITGITEKWALDKLLGPAGNAVRNQFTGALARIGIAGASEGAQEFSENMLQDLLRMGLTNSAATPDLVQSLQEGGVGAGVGVVVRGMVEGMLHVRSRGARAEHQAQQAEVHAQVLGELSTLAEASKLRERDPAVFASFMQSLTDEGVPNVYVDAKTLQTLDLRAVAQVLPSVAEQIEQAANTGGDVVIPTAELLTAGPGSDFMQTLLDNVRTSPEAMSTAEARTYMQTKGDQLAADIDKVLNQQEQNHERQQMRDQLRDEFKAQLDGVRRFTQDVNLQYANLLANFYSVTADKLGITPQELASRYALKVQAKGVEGGQVLDQGATLDDVLQGWTGAGVEHAVRESGDRITVSKIVVPENDRGQGAGTAAMRALLAYADRAGKHVVLTPSADFGGDKARLVKFYKGLGFVENKGKNRAFSTSESMYRQAPGKVLHQFAGEKARTADHLTLAAARDRVTAGEDPETVRRETGWHQGPDGKWRFEITDHEAQLLPALKTLQRGGFEARPVQSITYQGSGPGRWNVVLNPKSPQAVEDFVELLDVDAEVLRAVLPANAVSAIERGAGVDDLMGDLDPAKGLGFSFDFDGLNALPLRKVLDHPRLFAAYPQLGETLVQVDPRLGVGGAFVTFDGNQHVIRIGLGQQLTTLLHEIQHGIQSIEGFAVGGSPNADPTKYEAQVNAELRTLLDADPKLAATFDTWAKDQTDMSVGNAFDAVQAERNEAALQALPGGSKAMDLWGTLDGLSDPDSAARVMQDRYFRLAGEVEARNTQARANFDEWDRQHMAVENPGDVPTDQVIVVFDGNEIANAPQPANVDLNQQGDNPAVAPHNAAAREIVDAIKSDAEEYPFSVYGLRVIPPENGRPEVGDELANSRVWVNGDITDDELPGVSTIGLEGADEGFVLRALRLLGATGDKEQNGYYLGKHVVLVRGDSYTPGEDRGEHVISGAVVVGVWDKTDEGRSEVQPNEQTAPESQGATMAQEARGSINLPDNLTESPSIVSLFEGADLSTFIHESGHFFLEVQIDLAARIQGQINDGMAVSEGERQIVQDARTLLTWMGMPGGDTDPLTEWHSLDIEAKRPMHEQFARGFEAYAFEGRAPSVELQSTFQKFRAWMLAVYKELKALRVALTDDVRQVMDRMLASEQAIEEAEAARRMGPLFKTAEEAGMTLDEFKAYHALANDASQVALEELQARGLRDMRWLENARTGKLKEMQDLHASLRREVRAEVRRDVMSQPVYRAWQFLTAKEERADTATPADKPKASKALDPTRDSLFTAVAKLGGLDKAEAISLWGLDPKEKLDSGVFGAPVLRAKDGLSVDALGERLLEAGYLTPDESGRYDPQELEEKFDAERRGESIYSFWFNHGEEAPDSIPEHALAGKLDMPEIVARYGADKAATLQARKMTSKSRGIDADVIAEHVGFDSGDAMVQALLDAEAPQSVIEGMTDQRMLERYGDLGTPEGLQRAADRAIHNDVRARFLASEIKALERGMQVRKETGGVNAKGQRVTVDVMAQVARQQAERIVGATKVKNLKPGQYTAAEARAARAAERAMLEGKTDEALAEKRHQLINAQAAKAALRAQDEVEKTVAYLRKFNDKPKGLDVDYHDQIVQLLERFDLARGTTLREIDKRKSLQEWLESQRAQGLEPDIPPELLREAQRVSYKDTTVDELRGLRDTVRQIERLGRLKNQLLTAKQLRDFQAVRDLIADSIDANAGDRQADTRTPQAGTFAAWFQKVRNFGAAHIKAASWARIFDGGKDGGPVWEYFIRPANEAANMETRMRAEATEKLTALLAPVLNAGKLHGKGQHFPSVGRSMNREQVLALALNMGNEGNIQRMLDGENWTVGQIQPVLASLSATDWQTVQAVWDHFESYRPLIAAKERRIYGKEPAWVEPMPLVVQTSEGTNLTLRGGYYPIKYDPLANNRAEQHADAEDAKRQMQAAYTSATTRRGFTKTRAEAVKNRPLLYSLSAVYSGTNDVIHDLAFHEWLIDVNKLLRADKINDAIRQAYGPAAVRQLKTWIEDTARGDSATQAELDSTLGRLRHGISVAGLGFNVVSAMMQPLGLTQSIVRIGAPWVGKGVLQYVAGPVAAARRVNEMSDFMAGRTRTRFRELNELRNQVEGETRAQELVGRYAYFLMMRVQQAVDVPTWLGAYEKALADGQPDERAVALADQAVIDAQGGGQTKDLSAIERGGPAQKLFTVFYSFMNTALNLGVTQGMTEKSRAKLAADMLLLYTVPVVLGAALKDALVPGDSGEWDDWEKIVKRLLAEQVGFLMGLMVVTREFGDAAKSAMGLVDHARDYSGPAGTRLIADTYGLAKQVSQGEFDDAFRKSLVNVTGDLFGLPSAQVNRSITGVQALMEGETSNPAAAVFGYQAP